VGLVLGCAEKLGGGQINPFFENRIHAAVNLFDAHKVDYFLVSGGARPKFLSPQVQT
jgi:SanA protein